MNVFQQNFKTLRKVYEKKVEIISKCSECQRKVIKDKEELDKKRNGLTGADYNKLNNMMPNEFKNFKTLSVLYVASIHGFGANDFHFNVDGRTNILVIITTNEGRRFGAFTCTPFTSSNSYKIGDHLTSFIFSLDKNTKFNLKKNNNVIHDAEDIGPCFGNGHDINISSNSNLNILNYASLVCCHENESLKLK